MLRSSLYTLLSAIVVLSSSVSAQGLRSPNAGEIYRDYSKRLFSNDSWRVTDPNATFVGDPSNSPSTYLPNATPSMQIGDLQDAIRAEAVIDVWGGHVGTTGKRMRFNGNAWLTIPELSTTPGPAQCWTQQANIVIDVPLSHLVQGGNVFEGTSGGQTCFNFNWGQWGWYMVTVRVYYAASKPHPTGAITTHSNGGFVFEGDTITCNPAGPSGISRVEYFAHYDGYDTDGDGVYTDWHHSYHRTPPESTLITRNHVGTATSAPWSVTWNTDLVPDQQPGDVKLVARIRGNDGIWFVTDVVDNLTLQRFGNSVKMYRAQNVMQHFWVRDGDLESSTFFIPAGDDLGGALSATLAVRTWNGIDGQAEPGQFHWTKVNDWTTPNYGADHHYSYDKINVPPSELVSGTNFVTFHSTSSHHGVEILWPGPAVIVRYAAMDPPAAPTGLLASTVSDSEIFLDWSDSPEPSVAGYNVYRSQSSGFVPGPANLVTFLTPASQFTDSGLDESTTYYYVVTALDGFNGESDPSGQASATTDADVAPPGIAGAVSREATLVVVEFTEPVDQFSAEDIANFTITEPTGPDPTVLGALIAVNQESVTLTVSPLTQGLTYTLNAANLIDLAATPNIGGGSVPFQFDSGLDGHWTFDEGVGSIAGDASGAGNDGAINGATWTTATGDGSPFALSFDGVDDSVDLGGIDVNGTEMTMALWAQIDDFDFQDSRLISKATGVNSEEHYWMISTILDGGVARLRLRLKAGGTTTTLIGGSGSLEEGVWTHIAAVYDGAEMRLFKDGVLVGSTPKGGAIDTSPGVEAAIGNQPPSATNKPFDGRIDDVRLYHTALSLAEIQDIVNGPAPNAPPVANDDAYTTDFQTPFALQPLDGVLANDTDDNGDVLSAALVMDAVGDLVLSSNGSVSYMPLPGFAGQDTFTYTASDGEDVSAPATVTIDVMPNVDAPVGTPDSYSVLSNEILVVPALTGVLDNDSDPNMDMLTAVLLEDVQDGMLVLGADGAFTYEPVTDFIGIDSFVYQCFDGLWLSPPTTVTIGVTPDPSLALLGHWPFEEGAGNVTLDIGTLGNDGMLVGPTWTSFPGDGSSSALEFDGAGDRVDVGTPDVPGSLFTVALWLRADSFGIQDGRLISKAVGLTDQEHHWMLSTIQSGAVHRLRFRLKAGGSTSTLIAGGGDLQLGTWVHAAAVYDGASMTLFVDGVAVGSIPKTGPLATDPTIPVAFGDQPPGAGSRPFHGGIDDVRLYALALTQPEIAMLAAGPPPHTPPDAFDDDYSTPFQTLLTVAAASGVLDNDMDNEGGGLEALLQGDVSSGTLALALDGSFTYDPMPGFSGLDSFTYRADDGTALSNLATVQLTVMPNPDMPTAMPDSYMALAGMLFSVDALSGVLDNDTDPTMDPLMAVLSMDVSNGTLMLAPDGSFTYMPAMDFSGPDSFQYFATDGMWNSEIVTVDINVSPNPDSPVSAVDMYSMDQDTMLVVPSSAGVLFNDSDPNMDMLTAILVDDVSAGMLMLAPDGGFTYTPPAGFADFATFTYRASDGVLLSPVTTVTIDVMADVPSGLLLHYPFEEGGGSVAENAAGPMYDGAIFGAVHAPTSADGSSGSLQFDGLDDHVNAGNLDVTGSAITLAAWLKADDFDQQDGRIISKATGPFDQDHFWMLSTIKSGSQHRLRFRLKAGGVTTTLIAGSGNLIPGTWHHAAAVYDGASMTLYLDGAFVGSTAKSGPVDAAPTVSVGVGNQPPGTAMRPFDGCLDDVRVYAEALSAGAVATLAAPPPMVDTTPPALVSAAAEDDTTVRAIFSEDVDPATAESPANYMVTPGIAVIGAVLQPDGRTVMLQVAALTAGTVYELTATGVLDLAPVPNASASSANFVLAPRPVAHIPCDEGVGGTAADVSGNGHDAVLSGAGWSAQTADGSASSLDFDGGTDSASLGAFGFGGQALTIAAWVRPDDFGVSDGRIVSKATGVQEQDHWWMISTIKSGSSYYPRLRLKAGGSTSTLIAGSGALTPGQWTHVAAVYDGATMSLYVDGILVGTMAKSGDLDPGAGIGVAIGNQPAGAGPRPFDGRIDDVRIYNSVLPPADIMVLAGN